MIIFYGWGKELKAVAYAGIEKCPNCKNWSHFSICDHAAYAKLYFVKVARWNKKRAFVCGTCGHGWELAPDKAESVIRQTVSLPSKEHCDLMWNCFDQAAGQALERATPEGSQAVVPALRDALSGTISTLGCTFQEDHVRYVAQRFVARLQDQDLPK